MAAPRASAESGNATLYVMIIFIVLFLVATVFAVMMYMDNEKYKKDALQAQNQLNLIGNSQEISRLQSLGDSQRSVLRRIEADVKSIVALVAGPDQQSIALGNASQFISELHNKAFKKAQGLQQFSGNQDTNILPSSGLINLIDSLITQIQTSAQSFKRTAATLNGTIEAQKTQIAQLQQTIKAKDDEINKQTQAASRYQKDLNDQLKLNQANLESLEKKHVADNETVKKNNQTLLDENQKLIQLNQSFSKRLAKLEKVLGDQRPKPDMELGAMQSDGQVVSVVPEDNLVYINLSNSDPIYRGLTFSVYDSFQEFPRDGKGKGTIEIIQKMDSISKCRITDYDPTNPILKGDIIANLFWDKNKTYEFCVTGDFDWDNDGKIDPDGRDKIINLITANKTWNGKIVEEISVDTDFMIVGTEPAEPVAPTASDEFGAVSESAQKAYQKALKAKDLYDQNLDMGKAMGVPTFNTRRFFNFIGFEPGQEH